MWEQGEVLDLIRWQESGLWDEAVWAKQLCASVLGVYSFGDVERVIGGG